jgi:hypothetical protein
MKASDYHLMVPYVLFATLEGSRVPKAIGLGLNGMTQRGENIQESIKG